MTTSMQMKKDENSSIKGIGTDIVEIERIRHSIEGHGDRLLSRLFSIEEQNYCLKYKDPAPHFAARFAAKEAISKALGTGFGENLSWLDFQVLNDSKGKPIVHFSDRARKHFNNPVMMVTMSHSQDYATAFTIWI